MRRYGHHATRASWSSSVGKWEVECENGARFQCYFLFACTGYYDHDQGYAPEFPGAEEFLAAGKELVHPQSWPEELEYADKDIVVIGSGATAITLVPSLAESAKHVVMLQRSPTYVMAMRNEEPTHKWLSSWGVPDVITHPIVRWKKVVQTMILSRMLTYRDPEVNKKMFIGFMRRFTKNIEALQDEEKFAEHFTPNYYPWEQRMCLAPDGDFYRALKKGKASIVTDTIERFDREGILLRSGTHLKADLIVSATGLQLQTNYPMATMKVFIDGCEYVAADHFIYKGCMLSDVPNFAFVSGYFTASWTLKADLICEYVTRILNHLRQTKTYCIARPKQDLEPVDNLTENSPGYVLRTRHLMPKTALKAPWAQLNSYVSDRILLQWFGIKDDTLEFIRRPRASL